ncbi:MAG: hypothetical protein IT248_03480 [Chitinophagaceae bacterium]|jgi:C1A family cysteine protease|nr:hypothetical protein [Chitinophagaceae bacterium]HRF23700.1 C1 family peptidase [Chitinophagaceae bacterium]
MKTILLITSLLFINLAHINSQPVQVLRPYQSPDTSIHPFKITDLKLVYQQRETKASAELKRLLLIQRAKVARNGFKYQVANTEVSELKMNDITGFKPISRSEILRLKSIQNNKAYNPEIATLLKNYKPAADASLPQFDSRNYLKMPQIRTQKCGSCWVYGTIGILEISYMAQQGFETKSMIDLSEKQVLGCSAAGDCDGGWHFKALEWLKNTNQKILSEESLKDDDYFPKKTTSPESEFVDVLCNVSQIKTGLIQVADWGIVQKEQDMDKVADEYDIKEAIIKYGAVATSIYASPVFQNFASTETFEENETEYKDSAVNHVVIIIGWNNTKQAWLIRNSWGNNWGDNGYAWIKFTTNHIGKHAVWAVAQRVTSRLQIPITENMPPVTLTGEFAAGTTFSNGSVITSPNGKYQLKNSNNSIWFSTKKENSTTSIMINPFNDYNSILKIFSSLPILGTSGNSPLYVMDKKGNVFTPFGDKPFSKLEITDSGNLIAYGKNNEIIWSLNPLPPKIRRK